MAKKLKATTNQKSRKNIIVLLWFIFRMFLKQNPVLLTVYLLLIVVSQALYPISEYVLSQVINQISKFTVNGTVSYNPDIIIFLLVIGGVFTFRSIAQSSQRVVETIDSLYQSYFMDKLMFPHYLSLSPQQYEDPGFIAKKNTLDWNMWKVRRSLDMVLYTFSSFLVGVGSIIVVFSLDYRIALLSLISVLPEFFTVIKFGARVWSIWFSSGDDKILTSTYKDTIQTDRFESFQEIKVLGYGSYLLKKALAFNLKFIKKLQKNELNRYLAVMFSVIIRGIIYTSILYLSYNIVIEQGKSIGDFLFMYTIALTVQEYISSILRNSADLKADHDLFQTAYDIFHITPIIKSGKVKIKTNEPISIEFKNVWFKYPNTQKWIFKNISFTTNSDEDIALVGKNGAGKSTLIKLILRSYDPQKGQILINGTDLKTLDLDTYYKTIGILSQDYNRLGITAGENISIGNTTVRASQDKIIKAASLAKADSFISKYKKGYNTFLTRQLSGGISPSGGQWQRIAIARIFYRDPRLLILDEPTSSIDAIAEEQIFENIDKNAQDKTVIIVSHRFATVRKAKRIIVLDKGELIEDGTHSQLMKKKGLYSKMYLAQHTEN